VTTNWNFIWICQCIDNDNCMPDIWIDKSNLSYGRTWTSTSTSSGVISWGTIWKYETFYKMNGQLVEPNRRMNEYYLEVILWKNESIAKTENHADGKTRQRKWIPQSIHQHSNKVISFQHLTKRNMEYWKIAE
jgi:hypothetical protein